MRMKKLLGLAAATGFAVAAMSAFSDNGLRAAAGPEEQGASTRQEVLAQQPGKAPLEGTLDVTLGVIGNTMATMGDTVARVADTFIVVLSGELEHQKRLAAGEGGDDLASVVEQMKARDELVRPGLKGPVRRFMDKYCILGYLTGKGTCDR